MSLEDARYDELKSRVLELQQRWGKQVEVYVKDLLEKEVLATGTVGDLGRRNLLNIIGSALLMNAVSATGTAHRHSRASSFAICRKLTESMYAMFEAPDTTSSDEIQRFENATKKTRDKEFPEPDWERLFHEALHGHNKTPKRTI